MPTDDEIYRGQEAKRLLNEPLLADALTEIRMEAAREVLDLDPTPENAEKIRKLQASARVCEEFVTILMRHILAGAVTEDDETA